MHKLPNGTVIKSREGIRTRATGESKESIRRERKEEKRQTKEVALTPPPEAKTTLSSQCGSVA